MAKAMRPGARPGRPPLADAEKLGLFTGIRWKPEEREVLSAKIAEGGYATLSAYVRAVALQTKLTQARIVRRADPAVLIELNRIGVNLNQIAKIINTGRTPPYNMLDEALLRLNELLDRLQDVP